MQIDVDRVFAASLTKGETTTGAAYPVLLGGVMRYTYVLEGEQDDDLVFVSNSDVTWGAQLDAFRRFLLACGYFLPAGELQFVDDETEVVVPKEEYNALVQELDSKFDG